MSFNSTIDWSAVEDRSSSEASSSSSSSSLFTPSWSSPFIDDDAGLRSNATGVAADGNASASTLSSVDPGLPYEHQYVLIALYTATTALAVTGNLIVIVVLTVGRRSRTDLRAFLLNLAVADLTMAAFCMPFTFTTTMLHVWLFGPVMCTVVLFVQVMSVTASVATSTVIAVDRYLVVTRPLRPRSSRRSRLIGVWTVAALLASVQLIVGRMSMVEVSPGVRLAMCAEAWPEPGSDTWRTAYTFFVLLTTYLLPLGAIAPAYALVARRLWRRRAPGNADSVRDLNQLQSKRRVIKMLIVVVTLFAVCWLPLHAFIVVLDFVPQLRSEDQEEASGSVIAVYTTVHWLAMSNSFVNPIVYGFLNDSFRYDLRSLVFSCWRCLRRRCGHHDEFSFGDDFMDDASLDTTVHQYQYQHQQHHQYGHHGVSGFDCTPTPSVRRASSICPGRPQGTISGSPSHVTASFRSSHLRLEPDAGDASTASRRRRQLSCDHQQTARPTSLSISGISSSSAANHRRQPRIYGEQTSRCGSDVALDCLGDFDLSDDRRRGVSSGATSISWSSRPTLSTDVTPSTLQYGSPDSGGERSMKNSLKNGDCGIEGVSDRQSSTTRDPQLSAIVPTVSIVDDCGNISENMY